MVSLNDIAHNAGLYYRDLWRTSVGGDKESYFAIAKKVVWNSWTVSRLNFVDVTLKSVIALPSSIGNFAYDGVYGGVFGYALGGDLAKERLWSSYDGFKSNLVNLAKGVSGVVWPQLEVWFTDWLNHRPALQVTVTV